MGASSRLVRFAALPVACFAALARPPALAHGGNYPPAGYGGPGDTVPAGGGGSPGAGPATPGPGGPAAPGPAAPGPTTPGGPFGGGGLGPATPGGVPAPRSQTPMTPGGGDALDYGAWELWWHYNSHAMVDFDRRASGPTTGSDEYFLGRGKLAPNDQVSPSDRLLADEFVPFALDLTRGEPNKDIVTAAMIALAKARVPCDLAAIDIEAELLGLVRHPNQEVAETAALALGIRGSRRASARLQALLAADTKTLAEFYDLVNCKRITERTRAFAGYGLGLAAAHLEPADRLSAANALHAALTARDVREDVATACIVALGSFALEDDARADPLAPRAPSSMTTRADQIGRLLALFDADQLPARARAEIPLAVARIAVSPPSAAAQRERVCERILEALGGRQREASQVRAACTIALGILGDSDEDKLDAQVRKALLACAQDDSDLVVRCFAKVALGQVGGRPGGGANPGAACGEIAKYLLGALARSNSQSRAWSALALACQARALADARADARVPDIGRVLRSALLDARAPAEVGVLGIAIGIARCRAAEGAVRQQLAATSDVCARANLCLALGMLGAVTAADEIAANLERSKYHASALRSTALALGMLGQRAVVPTLVGAMQSTTSLAAQGALAAALGRVGDARAVAPLIALARDASRPALARAFAVVALGSLADDRLRPWNVELSTNALYVDVPTSLADPQGGSGALDIF